MILRPYQKALVEKAVAALQTHGNTLAVAPTGSGKTIMLSKVASQIGGRQCILQHRDELTMQNMEKYRKMSPKTSVGMYTADSKSWEADATFAMVQTLSRSNGLRSIPKLDLLVIDEAHHAVAPSYRKVVDAVRNRNPDCMVFGVTATPARGDGKGLRSMFDNCCGQISLHSLITMGFLVKPRTFICALEGADDKLARLRKTSSGEYDMDEAAEILNVTVHNEAVFAKWKELAPDRKTIIFASNVAHARDVASTFLSHGVKTEVVTGETPAAERKAILNGFDKGGTQVLVNVAVLTEGYDSQPVSCVILLRPCSFKSTMVQMIGRGLRTVNSEEYPGVVKKDCLVLDFGNSLATHRDLESKVRFEDKTRVCPNCEGEIPCGTSECPICGYALGGFFRQAKQVDRF